MKNFEKNHGANGEKMKNKAEKEIGAEQIYKLASAKKAEYDEAMKNDTENLESRDLLDKLISNFPSSLKEKMKEYANRLLGYEKNGKLAREDVNLELEEKAKDVRESYIDDFGMLNKEYGKMVVMNEIDRLLEDKKGKTENLKKIAMINMDLNGLKAVNDLNNHSIGDEYLGLAVEVMDSNEIKVWAEARRLEITQIHDSGDEFSMIIVGAEAVKDEDLKDLSKMIEHEIYEKRSAASLVDLNNDQVLYKLYSIETKSAGEPVENSNPELLARLRAEIPEGFEFRAAISSGAINLFDALEMDKDDKNEVRKSDGYEKILSKMMGSLRKVSDEAMGEYKKQKKAELAIDPDPKKRMLARIYNIREAGATKMKQKKDEAEKKLLTKEEKEKTIIKMLESGIPNEQILKFMQEK